MSLQFVAIVGASVAPRHRDGLEEAWSRGHSGPPGRCGRASGRRRCRVNALDEHGSRAKLMDTVGRRTPKRSPEPNPQSGRAGRQAAPTLPRRGAGMGRRRCNPAWLVPLHTKHRTPRGGHVMQSLGRLGGVGTGFRRTTPSPYRSESVVGSGACGSPPAGR